MKVMMKTLLFSLGSLLVITGCGAPELDDAPGVSNSEYLLKTEPSGAQSVIADTAALTEELIRLVGDVAASDLSADLAVLYSGAARILRRIGAHLSNVCSTVVQPYHRIRHEDETV